MVCEHGLDEMNCPVCRVSINTRPVNDLNLDMSYFNPLKPENPFFKKHLGKKSKTEENLTHNQNPLKPNLIYEIPKPNILRQIPNFENRLLHEKLENLDIKKSDKFGISKKISLAKPEFNLEYED